jgi:hypothetical protein
MSFALVQQDDEKDFTLTRFWAGGVQYEITDARGEQVVLTEQQARFLVEVLTIDLQTPKP